MVEKRCLILGCTQTKSADPHPIKAIDRYTGSLFLVLNRFLREAPESLTADLTVYVLSAKHGLISGNHPIEEYDQKLTKSRADELRVEVNQTLKFIFSQDDYTSIFLSMSNQYAELLSDITEFVGSDVVVTHSQGGLGKKQTALKNWLWGTEGKSANTSTKVAQLSLKPITLTLRGTTISLTSDQARQKLLDATIRLNGNQPPITKWAVDVDGQTLSPKWATHILFDIPRGKFSANDARRVLHRLGFRCYQRD